MTEAYSHEVSSAGYWPGSAGEGVFYSYAYPEPTGCQAQSVQPSAAYYDLDLREFVLPYRAVRTADAPADDLLRFLDSTFAAAADLSKWPILTRMPAIDSDPTSRRSVHS